MSRDEAAVEFAAKPSRRPQTLRKRAVDEADGPPDAPTPIHRRVGGAPEEEAAPAGAPAGLQRLDVLFAATGSAAVSEPGLATSTAQYDGAGPAGSPAPPGPSGAAGADTVYRGQGAYRSFRDAAAPGRARVAGPVRSAASIRTTCRFDFAADLCKDYNETGFCGFGDSCKFIHDRGDYKSGWELEEEWEAARAAQADAGQFLVAPPAAAPAEARPERTLPDSCAACAGPFRPPVVETRCGHFFCERCALGHAKHSKTCPACPTPVDGQFRVYRPPKRPL